MTPFYFGPSQRRLFAILHAHDGDGPGRGGVVLAAPFGHEAIRTHRFYRVLADRLARLGFDALRFDYHGAGDSDGDDGDARLLGWSVDIASADAELAGRTGRATRWWMASRLGASAALLAHARAPSPGDHRPRPALALWDPVVDGRVYLDELRKRHVEALENSFSIVDPVWRQRLDDPGSYADEALGFAIPAALRDDILALRPESLPPPSEASSTLVASPGAGPALGWAAAHAVPVRTLQRDFEWTSDDSLNTALVPADALASLLQVIDGAPG